MTPRPKSRPALNQERIVQAAVAIADREGLAALTMRRLGQQLGVEAMSIYKHFAGKEEILDAIVDSVMGEIDLPEPEVHWKVSMRRRAVSAREVLVRHPWAVGMMESRDRLGPASLRYVDAVIGALRAGGFSIDLAARAFLAIDSYVYGFVVQETSFRGDLTEPSPGTSIVGSVASAELPHLAEMIEAAGRAGNSYADAFDFGLDIILDGLQQKIDG